MSGEGTSSGSRSGQNTNSDNEVSSQDLRPHSSRPGELALGGSRRTSCSSNGSSSVSCTTPDYDSGHYSGSNVSELIFPQGISCSSEDDGQVGLEMRAIRSELERLQKSERWYKNELKVQKRSKLDLLEKLYMNERKFMRENQKLQADCKRLYALCNEIEQRKADEKEDLLKQLKHLEKLFESSKGGSKKPLPDVEALQFEVQRQKATVEENENLIRTLRMQKQKLLEELRSLTQDRDAKLLEIEKKTIALECENRTITKRCLELTKDKSQLEQKLQASLGDSNEVVSLRQTSQRQFAEIGKLTAALTDYKSASTNEVDQLRSELDKSNSRIQEFSEELAQLKASYAERQLENEHFQAEIEQYKKMKQNFDKYVELLQGNSAELDSKCMEVQHLESVVEIQSTQLAELNRSSHEAREHWQRVTADLQRQLDTKNREFALKQQQFNELDSKRSTEIQKLRQRLSQLEGLNEKLISQLRNSTTEVNKKSSEIEQLKGAIRDLSELSVENSQLKKLLEVKDEELSQRKLHEAFISELQREIQKLKGDLKNEKCKSSETEALRGKNKALEEMVDEVKKENEALKRSLGVMEQERDSLKNSSQVQLEKFKESNRILCSEKSELRTIVDSHLVTINNLQSQNNHIQAQLSRQENLESELDRCRELIKKYESEKLTVTNTSHHAPTLPTLETVTKTTECSSEKDILNSQIEILRETSQKVPETCDSSCQVGTWNALNATARSGKHETSDDTSDFREMKLLQRVIEAEHRKRIGRYELHIRTLLGKLRSYRNRDAKEKSSEVVACEKEIETLRQQLRLALRRSAEIEHYKKLNLQLTSNLQSLTDDYKRVLLSNISPKPTTSPRYAEIYKLIDESNNLVPNVSYLTDSIDALKDDISQLKVVLDPRNATSTLKISNPVKRLSLMDELKAVDDSFTF